MKFIEAINPTNNLRFYLNAEQIHSIVPGEQDGNETAHARIYTITGKPFEYFIATEKASEILEQLLED